MQQRLPSLLDRPIGFAHRGASAHVQENTLDAFQLALRLGANGLESDVWLTADGVPVLDHDGLVKTGRKWRPIGEMTRAQLPAHIPTLTDLIDRCGADYHLSLDMKETATAAVVVAVVREAAPELLPRLWICVPSLDAATSTRGLDGDVKVVYSTRLERLKVTPERAAATLSERGIDALNMHHTDWNGGLVTLLHRFRRAVLSWGLEFEHQLQAAYRMGADGVYCDWVDRMMETYAQELGKPAI